jgi:hypothetical protein
MRNRRVSDEQIDRMVALFFKGGNLCSIAKDVGVYPSTVSYWLMRRIPAAYVARQEGRCRASDMSAAEAERPPLHPRVLGPIPSPVAGAAFPATMERLMAGR